MNEHELQEILVSRWLKGDLQLGDGETLMLAAWEVMANWKINDASREWTSPSIDFLALDAAGRLVAIELKHPVVRTPAKIWTQLCQVTVGLFFSTPRTQLRT